MSKIQYCHCRMYEVVDFFPEIGGMEEEILQSRGGITVAMEQLEPWFFQCLEQGVSFEKRVGIAVCSTDDNYNKKIGREISTQRLKLLGFKVVGVHGKDTEEHRVVLRDKDENLYHLVKYGDANRVYFEEFEHA